MVEAKPADKDDRSSDQDKEQKFTKADESYNERVRPFGGYILTFDTETFRFRNGQRARFGAWQLRGVPYEERRFANENIKDDRAFRLHLSTLTRRGIFYDPKPLSADETEELQKFIQVTNEYDSFTGLPLPKLELMEAQDFIKGVLYELSADYGDDLVIAGHNLSFDLGGLAQDVQLSKGDWYGGFSLKLCSCPSKRKKRQKKSDESQYEDAFDCNYHNTLRVKPVGGHRGSRQRPRNTRRPA
jgi:hypothetical protein